MAFTNIFDADLRLPRRVCIVAPGPNGGAHYADIPADCAVIAVSKAVLIPEIEPDLWMMNHAHQDWFDAANDRFGGVRVFSTDALGEAADRLAALPEGYYYQPPDELLSEEAVRLPVEGVIRYGATVSACAVQLAYNLGAQEILLCGVDFSGDGYFDGSLNVHPNHGDTWPAVRRLTPLLRWLEAERGLTIATLSPTQLDLPVWKPTHAEKDGHRVPRRDEAGAPG